MHCPECGASYPRGFSVCTHCEARLVADEAPPAVSPGGSTAAADLSGLEGGGLFCPECGAEYRQGVAVCADCEVPLAATAPAEPPHPEPDLVRLTEVSEPAVLPMVVGLLQSSGIRTVVDGDEIMGLWPVGQAGAGWTGWGRGLSAVVHVPADRLEEARALLAEVEESSESEAE